MSVWGNKYVFLPLCVAFAKCFNRRNKMNKIEWTDKTWNVITGCTQISPACDNCYAKAMTKRLQGVARKEEIGRAHV